MSNSIGNRLKNLRTSKGLTVSEMAKIIGVSRISVGNWERDDKHPRINHLKKYANYFNVSIDWVIYGDFTDYTRRLMIEAMDTETPDQYEKDFKRAVAVIKDMELMKDTPENNLKIISNIANKININEIKSYTGYDKELILQYVTDLIQEYCKDDYKDRIKRIKKSIAYSVAITENLNSNLPAIVLFRRYDKFDGKDGTEITNEKYEELKETILEAQRKINQKCDEFLETIQMLENIEL